MSRNNICTMILIMSLALFAQLHGATGDPTYEYVEQNVTLPSSPIPHLAKETAVASNGLAVLFYYEYTNGTTTPSYPIKMYTRDLTNHTSSWVLITPPITTNFKGYGDVSINNDGDITLSLEESGKRGYISYLYLNNVGWQQYSTTAEHAEFWQVSDRSGNTLKLSGILAQTKADYGDGVPTIWEINALTGTQVSVSNLYANGEAPHDTNDIGGIGFLSNDGILKVGVNYTHTAGAVEPTVIFSSLWRKDGSATATSINSAYMFAQTGIPQKSGSLYVEWRASAASAVSTTGVVFAIQYDESSVTRVVYWDGQNNGIVQLVPLPSGFTGYNEVPFLTSGGYIYGAAVSSTSTTTKFRWKIGDTTSESLANVINSSGLYNFLGGAATELTDGTLVFANRFYTPVPEVSITVDLSSVNEEDADTVTYTITRTGSVLYDQVVSVSLGGSAVDDSDYSTTISSTITIPKGFLSTTVTVAIINDTAVENDETVTLSLHTGIYRRNALSASVTIVSEDIAGPTVTVTTTPIISEDGSGQYVLTLEDDDGVDITATTITADTGTITGISTTGTTGDTSTVHNFTYTPTANMNGTATITVGTTDSQNNTGTATITVNVLAVNDAPSFTLGSNQNSTEGAATQSVASMATFAPGGGSDESAQSVLAYSVSTTNTALFSVAPAIATDGTLTYTPAANVTTATATVTVTVQDNGGTGHGGVDTSTAVQTFTLTVTGDDGSVNEAPVVSVPAAQTTNEDTALTITGISITDIDDDNGELLTCAISVNAGTISLDTVAELAFTGTNGSANFTVEGTLAALNAACASITYTPTADTNGSDTVTIVVNDLGNNGQAGGAQSATETIAVTITDVNDAPTLTVSAAQSLTSSASTAATVTLADISVADVDADGSATLTITTDASGTITLATAGAATFTNNGSASVTATGSMADINTALASVQYTSVPAFSGSETISITIADNGSAGDTTSLTATDTIVITVDGPPTITSFTSTQTGSTNSASATVTIVWSEAVTASAASLTLTNASAVLDATAFTTTTFVYNVTATAEGSVSVAIPSDLVTDTDTNSNAAGTTPVSWTYDATAPSIGTSTTITVTGKVTDDKAVESLTVAIAGSADETITVAADGTWSYTITLTAGAVDTEATFTVTDSEGKTTTQVITLQADASTTAQAVQ